MSGRLRSRLAVRRAARSSGEGDDGVVLIMCLIFIMFGMLIISPLLGYAAATLRTSRIQTEKANRAEAVRGALRIALADPKALYDTCGASGLHTEVSLATPGLSIPVSAKCTTVNSAAELSASELRIANTTTQLNSPAPVGTVGSQFLTTTDLQAWSAGATRDTSGGKVWLPYLPAHALTHPANSGYMMPAWAGSCRVFFPGTYTAPLVVSDSIPTFFASGVYYFESSVTFSGAANVVIGEGATESCTDNQDAAYNAINAPTNHNIDGLGATFVFGAAGRLIINDTGAAAQGPRVTFNSRLVDPTDVGSLPSKSVSIISVNGVSNGTTSDPLNIAGQLSVPPSRLAIPLDADAMTAGYKPSTLIPTVAPVAPETPIVDISFTKAAPSSVFIPGYIAVPQGRVSIAVAPTMSPNKDVQLVGGVLTALFTQTAAQPATIKIGLINRIVQKTFKVVSTTTSGVPQVTSVAIVQINDYGEFAVNSWVTAAGPAPM
ncbi:MAG: hypothetical protein RJA49_3182 [Actinomycetota bacterium]